MGRLMLDELLRQGVEVDVFLATDGTRPLPVSSGPSLRVIALNSGWQWGRWYSSSKPAAFVSSLLSRSAISTALSLRLLLEHRRRSYDAVFQLSQTELFLLGWARRYAPPIVVHPCTHAAGELRWHRAEQSYALRSERRPIHMAMRAILMLRSRLQPGELRRADLVIGPSKRFVQLLHQDYGVPEEKLRVLRHPVDLERFTPGTEANGFEPAHDAGPRRLLFISRISARKGVPEIIELSHRLKDLAGSVRLSVVGGATLWSDYRAHLADLNPDVADYVGGVPSEEMPALLRSGAMLLVPSRYEPGSITTGEALACGLPVVLSDEVGPTEVITGPHVRVHGAGDVDALEGAIRSLLAAGEPTDAPLRAAARANALAEFAPAKIVDELRTMIASIPERPPRAPAMWRLKQRILPSGPSPRQVRAGIARGVRLELDFGTQMRLYLGLYELELDRHLRQILRPGVSAFDVGAQHGYDTLAIACRTRARVASFECDSGCVERIRRSAALNPELVSLIEPIRAMVGVGEGSLGLDEWAYNGGFIPDFIKIDIEGAEIDALRSAERILDERHPALIIEVHSEDLEREAGMLLLAHGYRPRVVSQRRLWPDHRPGGHNRWLVAR